MATSLQGATVLVGGETATNADSRTATTRDFIVLSPIVIAAIWIILALLLGSLVAPTYLVVSVVLSFAAALGLSVLVFTYIFGHDGTGWDMIPFAFVFLIALGADYNIYIMSRVREETRKRGLAKGYALRHHPHWRSHHLGRDHPCRHLLGIDDVSVAGPLPTSALPLWSVSCLIPLWCARSWSLPSS